MRQFQRVYLPMGHPGCPPDLRLYGFVEIIDGEPARTYCASIIPSVLVHFIGWDTSDEEAAESSPEEDGAYFSESDILRHLSGPVFEAEDEDEAREECQGNW